MDKLSNLVGVYQSGNVSIKIVCKSGNEYRTPSRDRQIVAWAKQSLFPGENTTYGVWCSAKGFDMDGNGEIAWH